MSVVRHFAIIFWNWKILYFVITVIICYFLIHHSPTTFNYGIIEDYPVAKYPISGLFGSLILPIILILLGFLLNNGISARNIRGAKFLSIYDQLSATVLDIYYHNIKLSEGDFGTMCNFPYDFCKYLDKSDKIFKEQEYTRYTHTTMLYGVFLDIENKNNVDLTKIRDRFMKIIETANEIENMNVNIIPDTLYYLFLLGLFTGLTVLLFGFWASYGLIIGTMCFFVLVVTIVGVLEAIRVQKPLSTLFSSSNMDNCELHTKLERKQSNLYKLLNSQLKK